MDSERQCHNIGFNEDDELIENDLPSFGSRLEQFKATPARASRATTSRVTRSSSRSLNDGKASDSLTKLKTEDGDSTEPLSPSPSPSPSSSRSKRTSNASPGKKRKVHDVRAFEGMAEVPDRLAEDLDILFCGFNPGVRSSEEGFHYAHPSNRFYRILYDSGLTPHKLKPSESPEMPYRYKLGLTDLHRKCTARADQVPSLIFQAGASALLEKLVRWRPKTVCFIGMDVYRNFRKHFPSHLIGSTPKKRQQEVKLESSKEEPASPSSSKGKTKQSSSDVQLGLQKLVLSVPGASSTDGRHLIRLFVIPSTSGLAAGYSDADRVALLVELKALISRLGPTIAEDDGMTVLNAEDYIESGIVKVKAEELDSQTGSRLQEVQDLLVKKEDAAAT